MLSIEDAKKLIKNCGLADKEIEQIRDECHDLAEIIFEKWQGKRKKDKLKDLSVKVFT